MDAFARGGAATRHFQERFVEILTDTDLLNARKFSN